MQRYTIFFIIVNALHVSGGFSAHHQELKNCTHSIWYVPGLLAAYTASGSSKQVLLDSLSIKLQTMPRRKRAQLEISTSCHGVWN
jgi:hypothetical protein